MKINIEIKNHIS